MEDLMSQELKEVIVQTQNLEQPLLNDETSILPERCTITVTTEKAYYIIAFQVLLFLGLIIFIIVFGIKILG